MSVILSNFMYSFNFQLQAFDSVNHDMLMSKLRFLKFYGVSIRWFSSYLFGTSQVTKVDGRWSYVFQSSVGVPKGTYIGPVLFVMYTNDLGKELDSCSLHSYAVDCQLIQTFLPSQFGEAVKSIGADMLKV